MASAQQDRGYLPPSQRYEPAPPPSDEPRSITPPSGAREYYKRDRDDQNPGYGSPYSPPPSASRRDDRYSGDPREDDRRTYSNDEILDAGRSFFGGVTEGLARVVEYSFRKQGRPVGYILGEEGSGAIVAGLRYGEGTLYTKEFGKRKVYWQGPSIGYDFGANGSKSMTLVYNLRDPEQLYERFGGVDGSAYFIGGVGINFQQHDDVVLAPIRAGVGLRFGANLGYLKYTSSPTWNPF
jgi:hypothetical protein